MEFSSQSQVAKVPSALLLPSHTASHEISPFPGWARKGTWDLKIPPIPGRVYLGAENRAPLLGKGIMVLYILKGIGVECEGGGLKAVARILWVPLSRSHHLIPRRAPSGTRCGAGEARGWENMYTEKGILLKTKGLPEAEGTPKIRAQEPQLPEKSLHMKYSKDGKVVEDDFPETHFHFLTS